MPTPTRRHVTTALLSLAMAAATSGAALAQKKYDTGASDTEIKIGNIAYAKDASDPQWKDDGGMKAFDELLAKYFPDTNRVDSSAMTGYNMATTMVEVLRRCGDNLTRENVMKQAASLKQFAQGGLLPGVTLTTAPDDFQPIEQLQLMRFTGERWQLFGDVISGELRTRFYAQRGPPS